MTDLFDAEDIQIIVKGAVLLALLAGVVFMLAMTAGTAWRLFELAGGF